MWRSGGPPRRMRHASRHATTSVSSTSPCRRGSSGTSRLAIANGARSAPSRRRRRRTPRPASCTHAATSARPDAASVKPPSLSNHRGTSGDSRQIHTATPADCSAAVAARVVSSTPPSNTPGRGWVSAHDSVDPDVGRDPTRSRVSTSSNSASGRSPTTAPMSRLPGGCRGQAERGASPQLAGVVQRGRAPGRRSARPRRSGRGSRAARPRRAGWRDALGQPLELHRRAAAPRTGRRCRTAARPC